jgi:hypothetical protein
MAEPIFDHEKLDVYQVSIEYVAASYGIAKSLRGAKRHIRDQWLRAAHTIPLNIAEGMRGGSRYPDAFAVIDEEANRESKSHLKPIVSMLTRLVQRSDGVAPDAIEYEYEYEYRDAEYEQESDAGPEPADEPEPAGLGEFPHPLTNSTQLSAR